MPILNIKNLTCHSTFLPLYVYYIFFHQRTSSEQFNDCKIIFFHLKNRRPEDIIKNNICLEGAGNNCSFLSRSVDFTFCAMGYKVIMYLVSFVLKELLM